jgi:hypothetical protein
VQHKSTIRFISLEERKEALRQMAVAVLVVGSKVEHVEPFEKHVACSLLVASILDLFYCTNYAHLLYIQQPRQPEENVTQSELTLTPRIMAHIFLLFNDQPSCCKCT